MKPVIILLLTIFAACSFPKDPEDSLAKAKERGLKVGIVKHPPYTDYENGTAKGSETALVEEFAAKEGMKVKYVYGSESILVKDLEEFKLDIVIGGFEKETLWEQKAGVTAAYNKNNNCFLVAPGENKLLYKLEEVLLKHKQQ